MVKAGLNVMINSDDPPMFDTDLANEYVRVATEMRLTPAELKECALNGIRASWLDEGTKRDWWRRGRRKSTRSPPSSNRLRGSRKVLWQHLE